MLTALAILNIVVGSLALFCAICGGIDLTLTVNGQDVTREVKTYLEQEIRGYSTYRILGVVVGLVLAVGMVASGIGLLSVQPWARIIALLCAALSIVRELAVALFYLLAVNPALSRFFGRLGPFNMAFLPQTANLMIVAGAFLLIVYDILLIVGLLVGDTARAFQERGRADYDAYEEADERRPSRRSASREEEYDDEDEPRRRRRRPSRYDDEDDDYPRRGSRYRE
jgi:hypothetical protein